MTTLRLEARFGDWLDRAIASVDEVTLVRRPDGTYVATAERDLATLVRALAFAGIDASVVPDVGSVADGLRVRRVPLGEATAVVLRRRLARFRGPGAIQRCRLLLLGQETLLRWRRGSDRRERATFVTERALAKWAFA